MGQQQRIEYSGGKNMKKKLCALILTMAYVCSLGVTGASAVDMSEQKECSTTVISGEDAIRAYLEEVGEPYDPSLVEVIRVEYEKEVENYPAPAFIIREYERRNLDLTILIQFKYL